MCWGRGGGGQLYFPLINQHLLRGVQKKNSEIIRGGFNKMKGKNKEIMNAPLGCEKIQWRTITQYPSIISDHERFPFKT